MSLTSELQSLSPPLALVLRQVRWCIALLAVLSLSTGQVVANLPPPFEATAIQKDSVTAQRQRVDALPMLADRIEAYTAIINAYANRGELAPALLLVNEVYNTARRYPTQGEAEAIFKTLREGIPTGAFTAMERSHLRCTFGRILAFAGSISAGEQELLSVLALPEAEVHKYTRAQSHYTIAYCGFYTDNLRHASFHVAQAAKLFGGLGLLDDALEAYDGASTTHFRLGNIDSALYFARLGLKINPNIVDDATLNLALNYAEALMVAERADSALVYATRANEYAIANDSDQGEARAAYSLGNLNMNLHRYLRAQQHYQRSVELFTRGKEVYHVSEVLDSLGTAFAKTLDFEAAFLAKSRAFHLKDSLREDRLRQDVDVKVANHERDQMARELSASEAERALAQAIVSQRATERIALIGGALLLALALAFVIYRVRMRSALATQLQQEVDVQTRELRERSESLVAQTLKLSESNAELERFAYIASHDLKTPLRNVTSFLGLIRRRLPADALALVDEYLDIAIGNARHMNELITDVLEYSRLNADIETLAEEVTVTEAIGRVRTSLHAEIIAGNAELQVVGEATLVLPKGTLDQLLGNLVANGLKYNQSVRPIIKVVTIDLGDRVRVSVADNGIGIAAEYHDRIFEVFRRLHTADEYAGTGVGLAACRKIILRLGGDIRVESAEGAGSTFIVDLPKQVGKSRPLTPVAVDQQPA